MRGPRMHEEERKAMLRWFEANLRDDPEVKAWLEANPPPPDWKGTTMEWAWMKMPVGHPPRFRARRST